MLWLVSTTPESIDGEEDLDAGCQSNNHIDHLHATSMQELPNQQRYEDLENIGDEQEEVLIHVGPLLIVINLVDIVDV